MLDLYISNSAQIPEDPDEKDYLTSLSLDEHRALGAVWQLAADKSVSFKFFEDSALRPNDITVIVDILLQCKKRGILSTDLAKSAFEKCLAAFEGALEKGCSIVAFAD